MPRQQSHSLADSGKAAGISAFAFQGTNAHAIFSAPDPTGALPTELPLLVFLRRRAWFYSVSPHRMLQTATICEGELELELDLKLSALLCPSAFYL